MTVRLLRALASFSIALASAAQGQGGDGLLDTPGAWKAMRAPEIPTTVPAARARMFLAHMTDVLALLRATPVLAAPRGFVVIPSEGVSPGPYSIENPDSPGYGRGPLDGFASVLLLPFYRETENSPARVAGEGPSLTFNANQLTCLYPGWKEPYAEDSAGSFYVEPTRLEDVHGHPTYESAAGEPCVVITGRGAPLYVAVSRERFLRALIVRDRIHLDSASIPNPMIANMLKGAREMQRDPRPAMQQQGREMEEALRAQSAAFDSAHAALVAVLTRRLRSHESLLAGMNTTERAAPAVVRNFSMASNPFAEDPEHPFAPTALVTPNLAFFDGARPVTDVQVLTVRTACKTTGCSSWGNAIRARILSELEWTRLEALVR